MAKRGLIGSSALLSFMYICTKYFELALDLRNSTVTDET